ncbi:CoA transferase [Microbacterium excoecariae]|uniref:CoA transferase n=1 Tax=Microbacterium excoecariae TaxID=2715210 RepID=UPI00140B06FA|nr:CoA transferase [Microbacterium excoecariae]NHI17240.1 CoA transferase [Microbacterium excoecariae]
MSVRVRRWWRGPFDVEGFAIDAVEDAGSAAMAAAASAGRHVHAETTSELVAASFAALEHLRVDGRTPSPWAPLSGFFRTADGWIRTHGNYPHHAEAIARATGARERADLEGAARAARADDIAHAIVAAGGIATRVRTRAEWDAHPHASATRDEPWIDAEPGEAARPRRDGSGPLAGLRVLDLTRVLAGPSCSQLLACLGADVLRIDPPGMPEILDQHLATGMGKRSAALDLRTEGAAARELAAGADVVVLGYRPGSLERHGFGADALREDFPHLVVATLSAWGDRGPWGDRAGFDSIVQAATGIADAMRHPDGTPGALPVQALDYATGMRLAAAVMRLVAGGRGGRIRASLLGAATALQGRPADPTRPELTLGVPVVGIDSPHGRLLAVPPPLLIDRLSIERPVGGYGAAEPAWAS